MKICKITLSSLLFLGLFTFQSIVPSSFFKNYANTKTEYKVDERKIKVSIEDSFVLSTDLYAFKFSLQSYKHIYKDVIYTFKLSNNLFKPPITF